VFRLLPVLLLALCVVGCTSLRGARLYASGSEALEKGQVEIAIDRLERASTLVPEASEIQNHLGIAYSKAGREDDALRAFQHAVELDCTNQAAQENLATSSQPEQGRSR
jgi:Flp pilus assembly protein TadD